jgi:hypothetical protein
MRFFVPILLFFSSISLANAQETGDIHVNVPEGQSGRIFIDGKDTGQDAPATLKGIGAGQHQIQVRGPCTIASDDILLVSGGVERVELNPVAMGGFVEVEVSPSSAKIFLDQKPIGNGPNLGLEVECGRHVFSFRALQFVTTERTIDIGMGNVERIEVRMQQSGTGSIAVLVEPAQAEIFLDGTKVAVGPVTLKDVSEGSHLVGGMLEGFVPKETRVQVKTGESARIELNLEAVGGNNEPEVENEPVIDVEREEPLKVASPETPPTQNEVPEIPAIATETTSIHPNNSRSRVGRQIAGGSLLGASAATAWLSWRTWNDVTMVRYSNYVETSQDAEYYKTRVKPAQMLTIGLGVAAGATLLGGSALLYYDDTGASFHFNGRF